MQVIADTKLQVKPPENTAELRDIRRTIILASAPLRLCLQIGLTFAANKIYATPEVRVGDREKLLEELIREVATVCVFGGACFDDKVNMIDLNENERKALHAFFQKTFPALIKFYEEGGVNSVWTMMGDEKDETAFYIKKEGTCVILTNPSKRYEESKLMVLEKIVRDPLPPRLQYQQPAQPPLSQHYPQYPIPTARMLNQPFQTPQPVNTQQMVRPTPPAGGTPQTQQVPNAPQYPSGYPPGYAPSGY